jgi:predicted GNAT family acetyltransferase
MNDDDIILENAFTTESYRRRGIEMWTVKQLLEKAVACGAARVILFVRDTNTVTCKIVRRLGFVPYIKKTDQRFLFFRKINFQPISK